MEIANAVSTVQDKLTMYDNHEAIYGIFYDCLFSPDSYDLENLGIALSGADVDGTVKILLDATLKNEDKADVTDFLTEFLTAVHPEWLQGQEQPRLYREFNDDEALQKVNANFSADTQANYQKYLNGEFANIKGKLATAKNKIDWLFKRPNDPAVLEMFNTSEKIGAILQETGWQSIPPSSKAGRAFIGMETIVRAVTLAESGDEYQENQVASVSAEVKTSNGSDWSATLPFETIMMAVNRSGLKDSVKQRLARSIRSRANYPAVTHNGEEIEVIVGGADATVESDSSDPILRVNLTQKVQSAIDEANKVEWDNHKGEANYLFNFLQYRNILVLLSGDYNPVTTSLALKLLFPTGTPPQGWLTKRNVKGKPAIMVAVSAEGNASSAIDTIRRVFQSTDTIVDPDQNELQPGEDRPGTKLAEVTQNPKEFKTDSGEGGLKGILVDPKNKPADYGSKTVTFGDEEAARPSMTRRFKVSATVFQDGIQKNTFEGEGTGSSYVTGFFAQNLGGAGTRFGKEFAKETKSGMQKKDYPETTVKNYSPRLTYTILYPEEGLWKINLEVHASFNISVTTLLGNKELKTIDNQNMKGKSATDFLTKTLGDVIGERVAQRLHEALEKGESNAVSSDRMTPSFKLALDPGENYSVTVAVEVRHGEFAQDIVDQNNSRILDRNQFKQDGAKIKYLDLPNDIWLVADEPSNRVKPLLPFLAMGTLTRKNRRLGRNALLAPANALGKAQRTLGRVTDLNIEAETRTPPSHLGSAG